MKPALLFILATTSLFAQSQTVIYAYDNAGNRISRTIGAAKSRSSSPMDSLGFPQSPGEELFGIKVHPSVTSADVNIDIPTYNKEDKVEIRIYGLSGYELMTAKISEPFSTVELSHLPNGTYILTVIINGNITTSSKIIKQ